MRRTSPISRWITNNRTVWHSPVIAATRCAGWPSCVPSLTPSIPRHRARISEADSCPVAIDGGSRCTCAARWCSSSASRIFSFTPTYHIACQSWNRLVPALVSSPPAPPAYIRQAMGSSCASIGPQTLLQQRLDPFSRRIRLAVPDRAREGSFPVTRSTLHGSCFVGAHWR